MEREDFLYDVVRNSTVQKKNIPNRNLTGDSSLFGFTDFVGIEEVIESVDSVNTESEVRDISDHKFEPYHNIDHSAVTVNEFKEDDTFWCEVIVNLSPLSETEKQHLAKTIGSTLEEAFSR